MRDQNIYSLARALPRMSWDRRNLFNLWRRSQGRLQKDAVFTDTNKTLYQQRWLSKKLVRAYHGDYIPEKIFKRWYLPQLLPDVRPRKPSGSSPQAIDLSKWANQEEHVSRELKKRERAAELSAVGKKGLAPVGSLMFMEVERRIDVVVFRCCFAHSIYEARRLVIHGRVLLNGKVHQNANTRLAPGDMITVDPKAVRFIQPKYVYESEAAQKAADRAHWDEVEEELKAKKAERDALRAPLDENGSSSLARDYPEASTTDSTSEAASADSESSSEPDAEPSESKSQTPTEFKFRSHKGLTPFKLPPYASPFIFIPAYIEPSFKTCSAIYLRHPTARPGYSEIPTPYHADGEIVRLAWEWYTRVRPRMRSRSQLARMPENRRAIGRDEKTAVGTF